MGWVNALDVHGGIEELRYTAQDHDHTYDEVDDSAVMREMLAHEGVIGCLTQEGGVWIGNAQRVGEVHFFRLIMLMPMVVWSCRLRGEGCRLG